MDNFELLGSLARNLHQEFRSLYFVILPVFFALAVAIAWFKNPVGSPDFLDIMKRAFVATILLAGFQEISDTILFVANGVADKISDMSGLDTIFRMVGEKTQSYPNSSVSLLLGFNDLIVAVISYCSYFVLYIARYIMVALYHFTWVFLSLISPFLLLFHLFTSRITINLFKSLIEVASWKIVWSVLSAMLLALPFGNAYMADGNYLTVIVLNFVIALCMLGTPFVVKSLIGSGLASMSGALGPAVAATMIAAPVKAMSAVNFSRGVISDTAGYLSHKRNEFINKPLPLNAQVPAGNSFSQQLSGRSVPPPPGAQENRNYSREIAQAPKPPQRER